MSKVYVFQVTGLHGLLKVRIDDLQTLSEVLDRYGLAPDEYEVVRELPDDASMKRNNIWAVEEQSKH